MIPCFDGQGVWEFGIKLGIEPGKREHIIWETGVWSIIRVLGIKVNIHINKATSAVLVIVI